MDAISSSATDVLEFAIEPADIAPADLVLAALLELPSLRATPAIAGDPVPSTALVTSPVSPSLLARLEELPDWQLALLLVGVGLIAGLGIAAIFGVKTAATVGVAAAAV